MSFEQQFPSLKDKADGAIHIQILKTDWQELGYTQDTLTKYCLDKAKVKEAIDKISGGPEPYEDWADLLMKELGIE